MGFWFLILATSPVLVFAETGSYSTQVLNSNIEISRTGDSFVGQGSYKEMITITPDWFIGWVFAIEASPQSEASIERNEDIGDSSWPQDMEVNIQKSDIEALFNQWDKNIELDFPDWGSVDLWKLGFDKSKPVKITLTVTTAFDGKFSSWEMGEINITDWLVLSPLGSDKETFVGAPLQKQLN